MSRVDIVLALLVFLFWLKLGYDGRLLFRVKDCLDNHAVLIEALHKDVVILSELSLSTVETVAAQSRYLVEKFPEDAAGQKKDGRVH